MARYCHLFNYCLYSLATSHTARVIRDASVSIVTCCGCNVIIILCRCSFVRSWRVTFRIMRLRGGDVTSVTRQPHDRVSFQCLISIESVLSSEVSLHVHCNDPAIDTNRLIIKGQESEFDFRSQTLTRTRKVRAKCVVWRAPCPHCGGPHRRRSTRKTNDEQLVGHLIYAIVPRSRDQTNL